MRSIALCLVAMALLLVPTAKAGGLLIPRDGSPPIGLSRHRVRAVVEDGLARTTVRQTFVNPHGRALEAIYVFPLPEGAALVDVAMETGGSRLEGLLAERKRARKVYDEIVRSRRDPALVEQIGKNTFRLSVYPVLPTEENLARLERFVGEIEAKGGTALGDAFALATRVEAVEGRIRAVVLLSDGRPTIGETSSAPLVALAKAAGERGLRIYPFGVGEDVEGGLLRGLAAAGRGSAELFRPGGEIVTRLTRFLTRTATSVLADVELEIEGVETYGIQPRTVPDLYLGEQLVITGRYRGGGEGRARVSAVVGSSRDSLVRSARLRDEPGGSPSVKQLHARAKLAFLVEGSTRRP